MITVDLKPYAGGMVIAGRVKGTEARKDFKLDELDSITDQIRVIIPHEVISLNSSFFLGMFSKSIQRLGADQFLVHYDFECADVLMDDILSGIRQALNKANPLAPA